MPAKYSPYRVAVLDQKEREHVASLAAASDLSISNWFRLAAGLPPVEHGGLREPKKRRRTKKSRSRSQVNG